MKNSSQQHLKEHYQALRQLSAEELWGKEVPTFNTASPEERRLSVSLVRAVGVVFSETGSPSQKREALGWMRSLLTDPEEKIRRYAMAALPKLGSGEEEEKELLSRLGRASGERENEFLVKTLQRVGGRHTLDALNTPTGAALTEGAQRLRANAARREGKGSIVMSRSLPLFKGLRFVLECRAGLEAILLGELAETRSLKGALRVESHGRGRVHLRMEAPFSLEDLYSVRSFSTVLLVLGELPALSSAGAPLDAKAISTLIASEHAFHVMSNLSEGPARYRLEFASRRADASLIDAVTGQVFSKRPTLLNDSREAPWEVRVLESARGVSVELYPRLRPDPRFAYRKGDVPAASHPPLAAALVRLAEVGRTRAERIWDPFCGSGLELAECILQGNVDAVYGTDLSNEATEIASANIASVCTQQNTSVAAHFAACDFRQTPAQFGLRDLSLIITNPPLGKRVPVADLRALIGGVFRAAEKLLRPGGRLVWINPLEEDFFRPRLRLAKRQRVDLGFGYFHAERWEKNTA